MPYPLEFRPNTLVHTFDNSGLLIKAASPCQLFRPMLGLELNGLPANWDRVPDPGSVILRFSIQDSGFAHQLVGPQHWQQSDKPFFYLNEDPIIDYWDVLDGICWTSSPDDILSGFASKRLPVQDSATFVAIGVGGPTALLSNPRIEFGRVYRRTFVAGAQEWYNLYPQAGDLYEYVTLSETIPGPAYVTVKGMVGTVQNPTGGWTTGGGSNAFSAPSPFLAHGPVHWIQFNNTTGVDSDTIFTFQRVVSQTRKV